MEEKQPKRLSFADFRSLLVQFSNERDMKPVVGNGYAIALNALQGIRNVLSNGAPFRSDDLRIGIVKSGKADVDINLMHYHYEQGTLVFISSGSIIQINHLSEDLNLMGLIVANDTLKMIMRDDIPSSLANHANEFVMQLDEQQLAILTNMFATAHTVAAMTPTADKTIFDLIAAILRYYDYLNKRKTIATTSQHMREQEIFNHFIKQVNKSSGRNRQLAFYANKLCLSQRYLGTIIKKVSGVTAKEWIDRSTIAEIKVLLKHSNLQITQISDLLGFPNNSFFSKYFKRLTGKTPGEYKNS